MRFASTLLGFVMQIQVLHWMTTSYAQHEALGELYSGIFGLTDKFVEAYMGKYGRDMPPSSASVIHYAVSDVNAIVSEFERFLVNIDVQDTDLLNIRDEMLGLVHTTQYKLTFDPKDKSV